ncbi:diguanylate cyclase [Pseudomonas citronellolis]|uniref:diguanylate cyclase n=1 Tax=Pseudomonas citronellolis TaxID=53408 RepID=UPI0023E3EBFD|nr:diguanylate cyclase [Pseudomonas citronellolis]MDF3937079.1 diguanylate cyclase [Pseudomonas citronellolis]
MKQSSESARFSRSFARRVLLPRAVGLAVGFFCVAGVLWGKGHPLWLWALLVWFCYLWPLMAYQITSRSRRPRELERRFVLFDSLMGGFWIATIEFNVLPSVMMLSMLAMNNTAAGGARFVAQGFAMQLLGVLLSAVLLGFGFSPETSQTELYACIPMLVIHPMTIGLVLYRLAIQLSRHKKALRELSRTDSLTQLFNRGYWKERLQQAFEHCQQTHQAASLALIDVDHFKVTNDRHGHVVGDLVLRRLSEFIRDHLRAEDLAGRYGGDEFCVLLPGLQPEAAREVLGRLSRELATEDWGREPALRVSLSIGVAGFDPTLPDATEWLRRADQALYEAKGRGRDRIVLAAELEPA